MNDHLKDHFFVLHGLSPINGSTVLSSVQLGEAGGGGECVTSAWSPPGQLLRPNNGRYIAWRPITHSILHAHTILPSVYRIDQVAWFKIMKRFGL